MMEKGWILDQNKSEHTVLVAMGTVTQSWFISAYSIKYLLCFLDSVLAHDRILVSFFHTHLYILFVLLTPIFSLLLLHVRSSLSSFKTQLKTSFFRFDALYSSYFQLFFQLLLSIFQIYHFTWLSLQLDRRLYSCVFQLCCPDLLSQSHLLLSMLQINFSLQIHMLELISYLRIQLLIIKKIPKSPSYFHKFNLDSPSINYYKGRSKVSGNIYDNTSVYFLHCTV